MHQIDELNTQLSLVNSAISVAGQQLLKATSRLADAIRDAKNTGIQLGQCVTDIQTDIDQTTGLLNQVNSQLKDCVAANKPLQKQLQDLQATLEAKRSEVQTMRSQQEVFMAQLDTQRREVEGQSESQG